MRMLFSVRKRRLTLLGAVVVTGALILAPSSQTASTPQSGPEGAEARKAHLENKRRMIEQEPLVRAAHMIKDTIDLGPQAGYAGIVIEEAGVAVWWKGPAPRRVAAVVAEANKIGLASVRIAQAKHSRAELRAAAARIRENLPPGAPIHAIKDPGDGSRLIVAAALEMRGPGGEAAIRHWIPEVGVATEVVFQEELKPISRNDDAPPWSGGAVIVNATIGAGCTSGFGVLAAGSPAVLTAGHCATQNGQRFQDGSGQFIGNAAQKTNHDQLIIPTTSTSNRMYVGNRQSNTTKQVTGWEPCFIGELLCQSGTTTAEAIGSELCGLRVMSFDTDTESLVEATQINGLQGARPGDSGGPLYSERANSTVVAKGTMTRVAGPNIGFQDIPTANQDFGGIQIPGTGGTAIVQLFQHCAFGGWQANFNNTGNVSTAQLQAAGGVNNDASSIRVASGFRAVLFTGDNQTGTAVTVTGENSCFVGINFNDVLSSMRIEQTGGAGVVFFQHSSFGGAQTQALARGNYTLADLTARGFVNDWASSVRIPAGFTVVMFQHDGFTGTSWTLTADTPSFSALSPSANDQVSSVRIQ
jgi:hypothetical protein